jgi:thiol:disulfide interchange protein DsbD
MTRVRSPAWAALLVSSVVLVTSSQAYGGGLFDSLFKRDGDDLLQPEKAFQFKAAAIGSSTVSVVLQPAPGYYLYRDRTVVKVKGSPGFAIKSVQQPRGEMKDDPNFGKMEVHRNPVDVRVEVDRKTGAKSLQLEVTYQGCHEKRGVCYPLTTSIARVTMP